MKGTDTNYIFCTNCGTTIKEKAKFCHNCGHEILESSLTSKSLELSNLALKYFFIEKNSPKAMELCQQAIEFEPRNGQALSILGLCYYELKNYFKAIETFEKIIEFEPDHTDPYVWYHLGQSYWYQRNYPKTIESFEKTIIVAEDLLRKSPQDETANLFAEDWHNDFKRPIYIALAAAYNQMENPSKAASAWEKFLEFEPNEAYAWASLGNTYDRQGKYLEAIKLLKKALKLDPNEAYAWASLGTIYGWQGKYSEAIKLLKKALKLDPNKSYALASLGTIYDRQGKYSEAIKLLKKALKLDPNNDKIRQNLRVAQQKSYR